MAIAFSASCCRFLSKYGYGNNADIEVYKLIDEDFAAIVPDVIGLTLEARIDLEIESSLAIVGMTGEGQYIALVANQVKGDECPIAIFDIERDSHGRIADGFGGHLFDEFKRQLGSLHA